ncbi:MAG: hypothetical protein AAFQ82_01105 [Myxococcota bacterium]
MVHLVLLIALTSTGANDWKSKQKLVSERNSSRVAVMIDAGQAGGRGQQVPELMRRSLLNLWEPLGFRVLDAGAFGRTLGPNSKPLGEDLDQHADLLIVGAAGDRQLTLRLVYADTGEAVSTVTRAMGVRDSLESVLSSASNQMLGALLSRWDEEKGGRAIRMVVHGLQSIEDVRRLVDGIGDPNTVRRVTVKRYVPGKTTVRVMCTVGPDRLAELIDGAEVPGFETDVTRISANSLEVNAHLN